MRFPEFSGEWKKCIIQDYGEVITGNTPPTNNAEYYNNGSYLWASPADLGTGKKINDTKTKLSESGFKKTRIIPKGSILVTCIGSTIGKIGMAVETMSSNQQINSIIVNEKSNNDFVYYAISRAFPRYLSEVGVQAVPILSKSNFEKLPNYTTSIEEQDKTGYFLNLLDERIATQNKIIEKLETLIKGIVELSFNHAATSDTLGCHITQISQRNKNGKDLPVLSVSNKHGFVEQSEQFEDRIIASDDKSNYKIVSINDFAFNPARINVGSIARLKDKECGIVSPMYICFRTSKNILPEYLELFFKTVTFSSEVVKRLEGSVRLCLSYESLCEIVIPVISIKEQQSLVKMATAFYSKLDVEKSFLRSYQSQKQYLLSQMFI